MSGIKVTVLGPSVPKEGDFTNDKGEKVEYKTFKQKARLEANGFAYPFDVRLEEGQKDYPEGDYELDIAAMLNVNKGVASLSKFAVLRKPAGK